MTDPIIYPENNQKKPLENMVSSSELPSEGANPAVEISRNAQMEVVHSALQPSSVETQAPMSVVPSSNQMNEAPGVPTVRAIPTPAAREIQAQVEAGIAQIKRDVVETQMNVPIIPEATVINPDFILSKGYSTEEKVNYIATNSSRGEIINLFQEIGQESPYEAVESMRVIRLAYKLNKAA